MAHHLLAIFRRRLFTCLTILSLVLCLATLALWVRSYWLYDELLYVKPDTDESFGMQSTFGELSLWLPHFQSRSDYPTQGWVRSGNLSSAAQRFSDLAKFWQGPRGGSFLGFGFGSFGAIWFPHWFLALIFAVLPALRLRSILRTRRQNRVGLCQHCGYDLRASPDRCPECGHVARPVPNEPEKMPSGHSEIR